MKKRVVAAVLAGLMAFSLTACGSSSDSKTETNTESKTEERELPGKVTLKLPFSHQNSPKSNLFHPQNR